MPQRKKSKIPKVTENDNLPSGQSDFDITEDSLLTGSSEDNRAALINMTENLSEIILEDRFKESLGKSPRTKGISKKPVKKIKTLHDILKSHTEAFMSKINRLEQQKATKSEIQND